MNSRLLAKLDSEIAKRSSEDERDALIAERASYLARLGNVDLARVELEALRSRLPRGASATISTLVHIADGLCHYYTDMGPEAKDRFMRAHALARAVGLQDLAARAASWLALVHYGDYRFTEMVKCLDECLLGPQFRNESSTLSRASLIVAQTIHLANQFDRALPWYRRAHLLATETEDEATISALMHNMASIWATNVRNAALGGPFTADSSRQALAGALSTLNFDDLVGLSSLSIFTPLLRAQIYSIEGDYEQALALYEQHLDCLNLQAVQGWQVWLLADKGRCQLQLGNHRAAEQTLGTAIVCLRKDMHIDDVAAVAAVFERSQFALAESESVISTSVRSAECWARFGELQNEMLKQIEGSEGVKNVIRRKI